MRKDATASYLPNGLKISRTKNEYNILLIVMTLKAYSLNKYLHNSSRGVLGRRFDM